MSGRQVTVGGEPVALPTKFRSYKAVLALDILSGVSDKVRDLLQTVAAERRDYAEANKITITRQMCIERAGGMTAAAELARKQAADDAEKLPAGVSADDLISRAEMFEERAASWERQLADMGDKQFVEFPGTMPAEEEVLVAIPEAMKMRDQLVQLLALGLTPDSELKSAWRSDSVHELLLEKGMDLLEELELGEEVEILVAMREVIEEQLRPRKQAMERLQALYSRQGSKRHLKAVPEEDEEQEATTKTNGSPTSSTPSPPATDGDPSESSSDSPTEPTSPSPVA